MTDEPRFNTHVGIVFVTSGLLQGIGHPCLNRILGIGGVAKVAERDAVDAVGMSGNHASAALVSP